MQQSKPIKVGILQNTKTITAQYKTEFVGIDTGINATGTLAVMLERAHI